MSGLATQEITLIRPTSEPSISDDLQRDRSETDETKVRGWLKQLSGERALTVLGVLTDKAYKLRFRAGALDHEIEAGWRVRDGQGTEYTVKMAMRTGGLWNLTLEAV